MPLTPRLPKRGLHQHFCQKSTLSSTFPTWKGWIAGSVVTAEVLKDFGVISKIEKDGLKVLGRGKLTKSADRAGS